MKKILFFGDSITDCGRNKDENCNNHTVLGCGYVRDIASALLQRDPLGYQIINRGISGNRVVDLYARIKKDVWNHTPDVLSILIGINDIWHEASHQNGVEVDRFEAVYRMLLSDTLKRLPKTKIIIMEPFYLSGSATDVAQEYFGKTDLYRAAAKKLADEFSLPFVELQDTLTELGQKYGNSTFLLDGVHPTVQGAAVLCDKWLCVFDKIKDDLES